MVSGLLPAQWALDPPPSQLRQQKDYAPPPLRRQRLPNALATGVAHDAIQASAQPRGALCSQESATRSIPSTYKRHLLWDIEQVFRSIKTQGFDLERSQIETPQAMAKLAIGVLIAAVRTMQLVHARSGATGQKLTDALEQAAAPLVEALTRKLEGKTARLKNPHPPDTLARLAWVVGRLGGWDGYDGHGYKPAGPKTMAIGLEQFDAIRTGWEMQRDDPLASADV